MNVKKGVEDKGTKMQTKNKEEKLREENKNKDYGNKLCQCNVSIIISIIHSKLSIFHSYRL